MSDKPFDSTRKRGTQEEQPREEGEQQPPEEGEQQPREEQEQQPQEEQEQQPREEGEQQPREEGEQQPREEQEQQPQEEQEQLPHEEQEPQEEREHHLEHRPRRLSQAKRRSTLREADVYNPFEHRNVRKPTSDFGALAHMLKTSLGSGILAMPMAFKNSGLVFGFFGTVVLGVICTHCIQMLIRNSQVLCARNRVPVLTFAETTQRAFENGPPSAKKTAKGMGILVTVQLLCSFVLGSSVYVVFMAQTMYQVVQFFLSKILNIRYYILMLWIPLVLSCMVRDLKTLVPFSILAIILVIVSFSIVLYYIFRDINEPNSVKYIAPPSRWPLFLTTVIFAIEGIGTVLSIENEMQHPQHFITGRWPVAYMAMTIVIVVYTFVGFFGYLEYGEQTRGSVTLNLPIHDPLAESVKILIALAIFFTYPLQFYVPINLVFDMIKPHVKPKLYLVFDLLVRVVMVTLTIIIALVLPNLEPIITIVGAIAFSLLGLMMPSLIDTMTRYPDMGRWKWRLVKNILISTLSIIALIAGTYTSILDIIAIKREA